MELNKNRGRYGFGLLTEFFNSAGFPPGYERPFYNKGSN